jgi:hypothetical protein
MTPADLLPRLADIFAGWERAEGIRILHAWETDAGDWRVEWIKETNEGTDLYGGGETSIRVARLIADIKDALNAHDAAVYHIAYPRPDVIRAWTADGQFLWWNKPDGGAV